MFYYQGQDLTIRWRLAYTSVDVDYLRGIILDWLILHDYFKELLHGITGANFAYTERRSYETGRESLG